MTRFLQRLRTTLGAPRLGGPRASLRTWLVALLLIATVPLALLMAVQHLHSLRIQEAGVDQQLQRTAIALAAGVERELQASVDALYLLGASPLLQSNADLARFRAGLQGRARIRASWQAVFLAAPDGTLLFDTATPGASASAISSASASASAASDSTGASPDAHAAVRRAVQAVLQSDEPRVSNLVRNEHTGRGSTLVAVPVSGNVRYVLGAWIDAGSWQALLEAAAPPPEGFLSLFDADQRLIARTRAPEQALGPTLPSAAVEAIVGREQGVVRSSQPEDGDARRAWRRVGLGQWRVGVEVPNAARAENTALMRALVVLGGCLLVGLWLAVLLARRVTEPLGQLARDDVDDSPPATLRSSPVREIAALQKRLDGSRAAAARARAEAERAGRAKDEFMARLGHDLRNPLAAIASALDVLNSPGASAELTATALEIAVRQTRALAGMLDDRLDPARVRSGNAQLAAIEPPPPPEPEPEPAPESAAGRTSTWGVAPRRIVLIEADADAARALQASLALEGHEVRRAADGTTGIALLLAHQPDAAIVDLGLNGPSGLTGFEVALRSRAAGYPGLMVAISASSREADEHLALQSGFDALLVKPVEAAQLRELLAGKD